MKTSREQFHLCMEKSQLEEEVYRLYRVENLPLNSVMEKTGLSRSTIFNIFVPLRRKIQKRE